MAKPHEPANAEESEEEAAEAIRSVAQAFVVGALGDDAQHDGCKQRKEKRGFEVREIHLWHIPLFQLFFLAAIS